MGKRERDEEEWAFPGGIKNREKEEEDEKKLQRKDINEEEREMKSEKDEEGR